MPNDSREAEPSRGLRLGILCSGGDSPGVNAAIRGVVLRGVDVHGIELLGFIDGWRGFHEGDFSVLDRSSVRGISARGGVIIGTSRVRPFEDSQDGVPDLRDVRHKLEQYGLDGLLLIGGNGTQSVARMLDAQGIRVIGLPKTIDNDLEGTDYTFGFDTAVSIAAEAIDRLRTTGESHRRCMVLEVMGRDAGWIALHAGMAGGAQVTLIPEFPESLEQICAWVEHVRNRGRSSLVVVAEGYRMAEGEFTREYATDDLGRPRYGGIGTLLAETIEQRTGIESRATVLGHMQRGGAPTVFDRVFATRTGIAAADAAVRGDWGTMASLRGERVGMVPLASVGEVKRVPKSRYEEFRLNFG